MPSLTTYIALLRGINVGGANMLPMKELALLLEKRGCADVKTYIQSGNVVFRHATTDAARLASQFTAAISEGHGFAPSVLLLTRTDLERAAAANPYKEAEKDPRSVHLFFLAERPKKPDLAALEALKAKSERFALKERTFYVHTPDGFGRSKLAQKAERLLGVPATARNWRTVTTLIEMAQMLR